MVETTKKSKLEQLSMSLEELNHYYRELRAISYLNDNPVRGIEWRKCMNIVCMELLKIDRFVTQRQLEIFQDQRIISSRPRIYACTHVGRYDIESAMEAIGESSYFVMGDPGETYRNLEGAFLDFKGRICLDTGYQVSQELRTIPKWDYHDYQVIQMINRYKSWEYADPEILELLGDYRGGDFVEPLVIDLIFKSSQFESYDVSHTKLLLEYKMDRWIGQETCKKYLQEGANILIYPEGAYNLSANQLTMKLFDGTARMALDTNAEIVPMGMVKYGKRYVVNIGKNIKPENYSSYKTLTSDLRDALCTLKWDIISKDPVVERSTLSDTAFEDFVNEIMVESTNGYDLEVIHNSKFIDSMPSPDEVFEPIKQLRKNV